MATRVMCEKMAAEKVSMASPERNRRSLMEDLTMRQLQVISSQYLISDESLSQHASERFLRSCSGWKVCRRVVPFTRRTTAMSWHPTRSDVVALGSHGGDVHVWDLADSSKDVFTEGSGHGGSIQEMAFHPTNPRFIYTSSVNGTFSRLDLEGRCTQVHLNTMDWKFWYCSLALSPSHNYMFAGTNSGEGSLMTADGEKIVTCRFHKKKIQHAEFVPSNDELFLTASNDRTIKVWDVRQIDPVKPKPLLSLSTPAVSNSAYFHPLYNSLLLVTCQNSTICLYDINSSSPSPDPCKTINHTHKFYQHLTPIKATWHPLYSNLVVVGRYGGVTDVSLADSRFVDIVDWRRGEVVSRMRDMEAIGVLSLNQFNKTGDTLVSGTGRSALAWKNSSSSSAEDDPSRSDLTAKLSAFGSRKRRRGQSDASPSSSSGRTSDRQSKPSMGARMSCPRSRTKSQRQGLAKKLHPS